MQAICRSVETTIHYTHSAALSAGDVLILNGRCHVAVAAVAANVQGAFAVDGIVEVTKQASLAIPFGEAVFWDDTANEADRTATNVLMGVCISAAAASDTTVKIALNVPRAISVGDLPTIGDLEAGVPFMIRALCTAGGAEDEVVGTAPVKCLVTNAWMISKDTSAANVTLKQATNAFTSATAKGTTSAAYVNFAQIVDAQKTIAEGAAIIATFSAAASAEIFILCLPVA